jgi:hypothetical protein
MARKGGLGQQSEMFVESFHLHLIRRLCE